MMKCIAFYSWQSDLPNSTNRSFIEKALENAIKKIRNDGSLEVEPVIDRDTVGVPGSPDIANTILSKIERAHIFVCDVSIINQGEQSRSTSNPNVLIELGYAMKKLGMEQTIMVMNSSFGEPELLPFDLRMRRVITYQVSTNDEDHASERKKLEANLEEGIRTILTKLEDKLTAEEVVMPMSISDQMIEAIENSQQNQNVLVKKYLDWLNEEIEKISPPLSGAPAKDIPDDLLVRAIDQTNGLVGDFAHVVSTITLSNNYEPIFTVYKNFEHILINYNPPVRYSGGFHPIRFDFYKFLGYEMFVILIAILIREKKWEFITNLLDEHFYIENSKDGKPDIQFMKISDYIEGLEERNKRLDLKRVSLQADILNDRHNKGKLSKMVPMRQVVEADFFLFLREGWTWKPRSAIYIDNQTPRFLIEASRIKFAEQLLRPLLLMDIAALQKRVVECTNMLRDVYIRKNYNFDPLSDFNPKTIGSQ